MYRKINTELLNGGSGSRRFCFSCMTGSTSYGSLETGIPSSLLAEEIKENMVVN